MTTEISVQTPAKLRSRELSSNVGWLAKSDAVAAWMLPAISSLKLTVALFVMGIVIILVGTLAQVDKDMWQVIDEYFRTWIARVELQVFFPRTWFPKWQGIPYAVWFPGGATIGALMVANLLAAHLVRFRTQASRNRLLAGLAVLLAGTVLTAYVITSGHSRIGVQGQPSLSWETLWQMVKALLGCGSIFALYKAWSLRAEHSRLAVERWVAGIVGAALGLITLGTIVAGDSAYLGDSGMRILWQLIQATLCGLVLLAGCILVFNKRGGIVLIHGGIGLMMFGQFYVSKYDVEEQMRLEEGQTRTYAEDIRQTELAIIDTSQPREEQVVVVPRSILLASLAHGNSSFFSRRPADIGEDGLIRHQDLPFDVQVLDYHRNADLRDIKPGDSNRANRGLGQRFVAVPIKPASGADSNGAVDLAAAYVRLLKKDGTGEIGTLLVSQLGSLQNLNERLEFDGKSYEIALRFERHYKPYQVTLVDVRKDDYLGTSTPRNYSSDIRLVDASRHVDRERIHIWMNNPLRYAGETFYQSGYSGPPDVAVESTTLSVVTNSGWMIPYVSCMIVIVGLTYHFTGTLLRFLRRAELGATLVASGPEGGSGAGRIASGTELPHQLARRPEVEPRPSRGKKADGRSQAAAIELATVVPSHSAGTWGRKLAILFPLAVVGVFAMSFLASLWPRPLADQKLDVCAFGRLPVIADGRVKPIDTLARNSLRAISNRETFRDEAGVRQPAIRWLLDVITHPEAAEKHRVVRIENLEVLDLLGLKRRKGNLYSIAEIRDKVDEFEKQVEQAQRDVRDKGAENLSVFQRKLIELDRRIRVYTRVAASFKPPDLPMLEGRDKDAFEQFRDSFVGFIRSIRGIQPPLAVPVKSNGGDVHQLTGEWQSYAEAMAFAQLSAEAPPALKALNAIFVADARHDAAGFNREVRNYEEWLRRERPEQLMVANSFWNRNVERMFGTYYAFEEFFNHVSPFFFCWFPYVGACVLAALSWLVWRQPLMRAAWGLTLLAFTIHTLAMLARVYISGRPPVTNLYSSAVFISWGAVVFCLVWELLMRNALPTFIGGFCGFSGLAIAHLLAGDGGDTFIVLQAVLDTQFWLATHVVLITMGYATTFLAGGIGVMYILRGILTPSLTASASKEMARMVYGTTCFALLFSFFGTVLGGLWADDSWGRFWGWDPKENGALLIVLWNALILHARWDGMVKDRGLAVLSVVGNIVTSWSWFGVNELGVGLHSYGFTEGVLLALGLFWLSQLCVIIPGFVIPTSLWWSFSARSSSAAKVPQAVTSPSV